MTPVEVLINAALADHSRNIYGQHGKRCPQCSGLGFYLRMGLNGTTTREGTKCHCKGSGLDLDLLRDEQTASLYQRIDALELALATKRQKHGLSSKTGKAGKMSRQYWMEAIAWATASGTAVANTTTETILMPNVTIPANYMQDGRGLRLRALGGYGTTATPTLILSVRWGGVAGTVLSKSTTVTTTSGTGGGASMTAPWSLEVVMQTRSNGSSGTLMTNADGVLYNSANPTSGTVTNYGLPFALASGSTGGTTPVAVTADLTADTALSLTVTWGTANAANSIQGHQYTIESLN